ncbi:MAG: histone deacetylase [Candidatus Promineifilaceae bacterium]|nr:histone deacetylase [Candidatus Promineifilaceae bacterium]
MNTLLTSVPAELHTLTGHPENAGRTLTVVDLLERKGILDQISLLHPRLASIEQLERVHRPTLLRLIKEAVQQGQPRLDADTYITPDSFRLARLAAGSTAAAAEAIARGDYRNGFALVRPPGHHAERASAGGFCLFNNIAVAARQVQMLGLANKVLILDYDVHHGNGTQDIFYDDPSVLFVSLHMYHQFFYPGTGGLTETGHGSAAGTTVNVPLQPGAGDTWYLRIMETIVHPLARQFGPDMILASSGFDAHWSDPLAAANLTLKGYDAIGRQLIELADELCEGRLLFVLEGGYQPDALSLGVLNTLYALMGTDQVEDPLGPAPQAEPDLSSLLERLQRLHLSK